MPNSDTVLGSEPGPAVAAIIWFTAQVIQLVNAATAGSGWLRKSVRECQPPMLLRPRLAYRLSSARISACSS